jgi:hypothetical protein
MNLIQMHERLRMEMLRRIQRGSLSISLLSRQTGLGKSHVSSFLHARRRLSLDGIDRVLAAQHMAAEDLFDLRSGRASFPRNSEDHLIPVVSHPVALFEPLIRPSAIQTMLSLPPGSLQTLKTRPVPSRRLWERFVAIQISPGDARPMEPLLLPNAVAVIDRHYNSLIPYREGRSNLYAVRDGAHLILRYADYVAMRLVLRPLKLTSPIHLIEIGTDTSPGEFIAGRVVLIINEL